MEIFDQHGYPVRECDIIKVYHFTDKRHRKYYLYRLVARIAGHLCAVDISEIAVLRDWRNAQHCRLSAIGIEWEIVGGGGPFESQDFRDRPKATAPADGGE